MTASVNGGGGRRLAWVVAPVVVFAAIAVMFAFALRGSDPSNLPSALIGKPAPAATFMPVEWAVRDGRAIKDFTREDLSAGKVTLVNFWASWCGPCIQEHPFLMALSRRQDIQLFGVNYKDKPERGSGFLKRHGNPFARLVADRDGRGAIEWGVYGMPETFLVDGKGRIVFKHVGPIDDRVLRDKLLPAIARAQVSKP